MATFNLLIFNANNLTDAEGNQAFSVRDTNSQSTSDDLFVGNDAGQQVQIEDNGNGSASGDQNIFEDGTGRDQTLAEATSFTYVDASGNTVTTEFPAGTQVQAEFSGTLGNGDRIVAIRLDPPGGGGNDRATVGYAVIDGNGDGVAPAPGSNVGPLTGEAAGDQNNPYSDFATDVACFAEGTMIETPNGWVAIEELEIGDMVLTLDRGPQPILWINGDSFDMAAFAQNANTAPVKLPAGTLDADKDTYVSPQHRLLFTSPQAELMFGSSEVLAPAIHFDGWNGIEQVKPEGGIHYIHFALDHHAIIRANGVYAETFFGGALLAGHIADLDLGAPTFLKAMSPARPFLKAFELSILLGTEEPLKEAI
ncbi:Hint domain-containing protein [Aestuariibius insulae]|uniref:Hint domain-containing protein n=1 Tax=Aestuariibius insulae TaxID=2058287 RepID=UPI00345E6B7F